MLDQEMIIIESGAIDELHHREEAIERANRHSFEVKGAELKYIRDKSLYRLSDVGDTWEQYCQERWEMTPQRAGQLIASYETVTKLKATLVSKSETNSFYLPTRETHVRPLAKLETPEQQATVWRRVVESEQAITAKTVKAEVERYQAELARSWCTLDEYNGLGGHQIDRLWWSMDNGKSGFNRTNENIEWAAWSWNPITGCRHGCSYCYAVDIANRFYPQGFVPAIHPNRFNAPLNTKPISPRWTGDTGHKNVFVCSMADLFGDWIPVSWIDTVVEAVRIVPQWNFLFLTKNPNRMIDIEWPDNAWVGTTVDEQSRVIAAQEAFRKIDAKVKFLSCEPLRERLVFDSLAMFDWVIVGGQSKTAKMPEFQPPFDWVWDLTKQAKDNGAKVYWKTNLQSRPREYPDRGRQ